MSPRLSTASDDRPVGRPGPAEPEDAAAAGRKSERTRQRLLDAAAAVLSRRGFAGTRLKDIADEAQVQAPAIYYYYDSREDLIEEVVHHGAAAMHQRLVDVLAGLDPDLPPAERVAVAVETHIRFELGVSDYTRAIIRNANQLPEHIGRRALVEIAAYYGLWRELVAGLQDAGQLRPEVDPGMARMLVLGALNWTAEWWHPEGRPVDDVVGTAQSVVLHGLCDPAAARAALAAVGRAG